MPTISMFYGILILMYFYDDKKHSSPRIHAEYQASIAISDGSVLAGNLPQSATIQNEIGTGLDRNS